MARPLYAVLATLIAAALVVQMILLGQGGVDANSGDTTGQLSYAVRLLHMYSYFTVQSNLLVLALAVSLVLRPDRDGRVWRVLHLDALMAIVITGIVFGLVLAGQVSPTGWAQACNIVFHYIAPWATLALFVAFGPRPRVDWRTVRWAFVWPVAWIVYTFVHGAISGFWPYPFLDADDKGYPSALAATGAVLVLGLVLAALLKLADRLPTLGSRRNVTT